MSAYWSFEKIKGGVPLLAARILPLLEKTKGGGRFIAAETLSLLKDTWHLIRAIDRKSVRTFYDNLTPKQIFFVCYEATQVLGSVVDVGLDIAVCAHFYNLERYTLFYLSLIIFFLAQVAYAFCFMGIYTRDSNGVYNSVVCFFVALPFSQIVPLFVWIESFHFQRVDRLLNYFNLTPTDLPDDRVQRDSLLFTEKMFLANSGFLVEALVEAIPQSLIQTAALVHFGEADLLMIVSILMSVFVIASKSYFFAFSVDIKTFIFNAMCVVTDITGLFATFIWTYGNCTPSSALSEHPNPLFAWFYEFSKYTLIAVLIGWSCFGVYSACDTVLSHFLGLRNKWSATSGIMTVWFDPWFVGSIACLVTIVPVTVLLLGCHLSLVAHFVLKSARFSHCQFANLYYEIFDFVLHFGTPEFMEWRLAELNNLFKPAMQKEFLWDSEQTSIKLKTLVSARDDKRINEIFSKEPKFKKLATVHDRLFIPSRKLELSKPLSSPYCTSPVVWFVFYFCDPKFRPEIKRSTFIRTPIPLPITDPNENCVAETELDDNNGKIKLSNFQIKRNRVIQEWSELNRMEKGHLAFGMFGLLVALATGAILAVLTICLFLLTIIIPLYGPYLWLTETSGELTKEVALGLIFSTVHIVGFFVVAYCTPATLKFVSVANRLVTLEQSYLSNSEAGFQYAVLKMIRLAKQRYLQRKFRRNMVNFFDSVTCQDATNKLYEFLD